MFCSIQTVALSHPSKVQDSFPTSPSETCFDPSFGSQLSSHISFVTLDISPQPKQSKSKEEEQPPNMVRAKLVSGVV